MLPERKSASVAGPGLVPSALAQPHAVRSVRETLRRWWGIELGFAGSPAEIAPKSIAISPENRICTRSEEHTSELQSLRHLVCRLLLEKKKTTERSRRNRNTT